MSLSEQAAVQDEPRTTADGDDGRGRDRPVPVRIAIIGYGKIAMDQHLPAIECEPRFELAATVDAGGRGHPGVPAFASHRELLAKAPALGIAAVAICTPPAARYRIARDCIAAGLHTLLEKPPGVTVGEVEALTALAVGAGTTLFTAWHAQANPAVAAAAEWLRDRRIRAMHVNWREDVRKWHPGQAWIWQRGGFGVFDPGINALSIVTRIFPAPLMISDAELRFPENRETPIAAQLAFASPAAEGPLEAVFDWRHDDAETWTIAVETSDGEHLELRDGGARLFLDGTESYASGPGEYPEIYRWFGDLIERGGSQVDLAPLCLVADAFLNGRRVLVEPFVA